MFRRHTLATAVAVVGVALTGLAQEPRFPLVDPGTEDVVDYEKYGEFTGAGTPDFQYVIKDREGLAKASGEGIDPNRSVYSNPAYKEAKAKGLISKDWWAHVSSPDPQLDFFVWCDALEDPGVRQFFVGKVLARAGHYHHALKAYRAAMILYPDAACESASGEFAWSVADAAWNQIMNLTRVHPELGVKLVGANVTVVTGPGGLTVSVKPGRFVSTAETVAAEGAPAEAVTAEEAPPADAEEAPPAEEAAPATDVPPVEGTAEAAVEEAVEKVAEAVEALVEAAEDQSKTEAVTAPAEEPAPAVPTAEEAPPAAPAEVEIVETRGQGTVQFIKYSNGDWQMYVEGKPFFIKGVVYDPTKVGVVPWEWNWMWADDNLNGRIDVTETWIDANNNGNRDLEEPVVGDFKILQDMGCNTIKTYNTNINALLMRQMFNETGIRVIIGDFLGAYCHDSGATWEAGTDYNSRDQKKRMKEALRAKVEKFKNEPWLLAWILGNENNMPSSLFVNATRTNANRYPEAYARFLNECATMIKALDPNHPVGVGNLMTGLSEYYAEHAPALDFIGVNSYIGPEGFGGTWEKVKNTMDRPVLITEYGCDSYFTGKGPDEEGQMQYYAGNWKDIAYNRAGGQGAGNSIGGTLFEFLDEWWKDNRMREDKGVWVFKDPIDSQNTDPTGDMAFPDGKTQEEWLGVVGQGRGCASPFLRVPKKAYYWYRDEWKK
ncbi:MAG: hypothetical protein JXB04_13225 [Kiritimatiellae bacterium]|nr:hypothetical protein [Kiritimatiellia bacterium]